MSVRNKQKNKELKMSSQGLKQILECRKEGMANSLFFREGIQTEMRHLHVFQHLPYCAQESNSDARL